MIRILYLKEGTLFIRKSGEKGAAVHAERILQTLHQSILDGGHGKVSTGIFNAVLNAHARTSSSDKSYGR